MLVNRLMMEHNNHLTGLQKRLTATEAIINKKHEQYDKVLASFKESITANAAAIADHKTKIGTNTQAHNSLAKTHVLLERKVNDQKKELEGKMEAESKRVTCLNAMLSLTKHQVAAQNKKFADAGKIFLAPPPAMGVKGGALGENQSYTWGSGTVGTGDNKPRMRRRRLAQRIFEMENSMSSHA